MQTKLRKLIHMNFHIKINFTHEDANFCAYSFKSGEGKESKKIYIQSIAEILRLYSLLCCVGKTLNIIRMENLLETLPRATL